MRVAVILLAGLLVLAGVGALLYFNQSEPAPPESAGAEAPPPDVPAQPASPLPTFSPARRAPATAPAPTPAGTPDPTLGTLVIESDVPETSVFIDRVYKGVAPVTVSDLTPGAHRLNMSATGYEGVSETIEVKAGVHTISHKFKEIRLDETVAVQHRHAIGSCSGTLHATPKGLTYNTDNESDRFTVALTDIETFAFDYLEKNLRVKIRDGKTYNFTDPGGQPDPLYRFYDPVEKVRQRLLSGRRP